MLNTVNELLRQLFLSERCWMSPAAQFEKRSHVRTRPLQEVSEKQIWSAVEDLKQQGHEICGVCLFMWHKFGIRFQEALGANFSRMLQEVRASGSARIIENTKGNYGVYNDRVVHIKIDRRTLKILEHAAVLQGDRKNLIPHNMSLERFDRKIRKQYAKVREKYDLPNPHEFRAGFACKLYEEATGVPAPIVAKACLLSREADIEARTGLSQALGHRRWHIASAYIGGMRSTTSMHANHPAHTSVPPTAVGDTGREGKPGTLSTYATGARKSVPSLSQAERRIIRARIQMENLMAVRMSGSKIANLANTAWARQVAAAICKRFNIMPRQIQLHHLVWFIDNQILQINSDEVARYWYVISIIVLKLGYEKHWIPTLQRQMNRICVSTIIDLDGKSGFFGQVP